MYTFRKFRKNAKALSPVVASIILIAVTVAVSIAVAAWMGALSTGFMQTEQLTITGVTFSATSGTPSLNNVVTVAVRNTGTSDVVISSATVNGVAESISSTVSTTVPKNSVGTITITLAGGHEWVAGNSYAIKLLSSKGTNFPYTAVAV